MTRFERARFAALLSLSSFLLFFSRRFLRVQKAINNGSRLLIAKASRIRETSNAREAIGW